MKKTLLILLLASSGWADCPLWTYPENHKLDSEVNNMCQQIQNPNGNNATFQTINGTQLNISSITVTGTVTGLPASQPMNILDNGGFEISQRGTSFSAPANGTYTLDRWETNTDEASGVTVSKDVTTVDNGLSSMKVVVSGAGASHTWTVIQPIENYASYRGKTVTASARVFCSVSGAITITISDGITNETSSFHSGGGGWETISVSGTVSPSANTFNIYLGMFTVGTKKNGTYYFDSAMLTVGTQQVAFVPTNPSLDLNRCYRFYRRIGGHGILDEQLATAMALSSTGFLTTHYFPVEMRASPTITVGNATSMDVYNAAVSGIAVATFGIASSISKQSAQGQGTVAAGLVAGNATFLYDHSGTAYIEFSADL